jgi:aspartate aminotransferase
MDGILPMTSLSLSDRVRRIKVSPTSAAAQRVRELKAQGKDIVDLTIGEPDFDTPAHIKAAAIDAINRGETKYTSVNGILPLREAISAKMQRRTGIAYTPEQITVGGGAKQIIFLALMASLNAGSEVIIPAPFWVSYPDMVLANDGKPVMVLCPREQEFKITAAQLDAAITPRTRWLILNTPSNPTGVAYSADELRSIADVLLRHRHVGVLTDEIYDEVWFEAAETANLLQVAPELADRILVVNGVSKTYAMTGWRIGYAAGAPSIIAAINVLQSQSSSCPSTISQFASVAALNGPQEFVSEAAKVYRRRRDLAVDRLNAITGIECVRPSGAFYLFPSCTALLRKSAPGGKCLMDDQAFVLHLLDQAGVAAVHGSAYGVPGHFRMSIATSEKVIERACSLIGTACAELC